MGRVLLKSLLGFCFAFVLVEIALQLTGLAYQRAASRVEDPSAASGQAFRILCIGDSNTYGTSVDRSESYPAQLELALTNAQPDREFEVINLGVPGSNSSQLLHRLPSYFAHYEPDLLIILIGVNDRWNPSEGEWEKEPSALDRVFEVLSWSRLYRLAVLVVEERRFVSDAKNEQQPAVALIEGGGEEDAAWEVQDGGMKVSLLNRKGGPKLDRERHAELVARNLRAAVELAARSGVPIVLPTYASNVSHYGTVNRVIPQISGALIVPQNYRRNLKPYVSPDLKPGELFFPDMHARAPIYAAFAQNLSSVLIESGLVR